MTNPALHPDVFLIEQIPTQSKQQRQQSNIYGRCSSLLIVDFEHAFSRWVIAVFIEVFASSLNIYIGFIKT